MTPDFLDWSLKGKAAESRHEWQRAAEYWSRALQTLDGNPGGLRTYYADKAGAARARAEREREAARRLP